MSDFNLNCMKHYYFDRDEFIKTVKSAIDIETLYDATMDYGEFNQSENFVWFKDSDEYYVLHKPSGMMINWYKHLGRTNSCNQEGKTLDDLKEFFIAFNEDLKEWAEDHHYVLDTTDSVRR